MPEITSGVIELIAGGVIIPWLIWVTSSLYNQRQEIALLKQEVKMTSEIFKLLKERLV